MTEDKDSSASQGARKQQMDSVIWFVGTIFFYFALQLWILPRFGIST